jgi:hypothetical protein
MQSREIIELILAVLIGLFMLLLIIFVAFCIKIVRTVNRLAQSAASVAADLERLSSNIIWGKEPLKIFKAIIGFATGNNRYHKRSKW